MDLISPLIRAYMPTLRQNLMGWKPSDTRRMLDSMELTDVQLTRIQEIAEDVANYVDERAN